MEKILIEPSFGYSDKNGLPYKPKLREIFYEWFNCMNFIKDPSKKIVPIWIGFHILTFFCFAIFLFKLVTLKSILFVLLSVSFLGTVYNTIWYHRYCSHNSFQFNGEIWKKIFLWLNPTVLREEAYVIPHQTHHFLSDKAGDPYGPHLGWLGSYLAQESVQKFNVDISESTFNHYKKNIDHIGLVLNSYERYKKNGSFENESIYIVRTLFAQILWMAIFFFCGGLRMLICWYASIFIFTFLMRDFNWWGHGGNFRFHKKNKWEYYENCRALNQRFYGYIAGEWHDNHHLYPASANNSFLPGQFDFAFWLIKIMKRIGIVKSYYDFKGNFSKRYLLSKAT